MTPMVVNLENIDWTDNADGTRSAVLAGVRADDRPFTYAFMLPPHCWDGPHSHGVDVHLVVVRGLLRLAWITDADSGPVLEFPTGSFLHVPAHVVHADGAADDETVVYGTAMGTWSTTYVDATFDPGRSPHGRCD